MPAKKSKSINTAKKGPNKLLNIELSQWNFIIFLTLAFILLVVVLNAMTGVTTELRSKAFSKCPALKAPRAEDCAGGWTYKRGADGCLAFFCEPKTTVEAE